MANLIITTDFAAVAERFSLMAADTTRLLEAGVSLGAEAARSIAVEAIKAETPARTGRLRDSTESTIERTTDGALITISQPAESLPNQDGSGGGEHYVQWVIGGRGDVYPVVKRALAGPGFGPVKHAGPAAPNPYNERAMDAAREPILAAITATADELVKRALKVAA